MCVRVIFFLSLSLIHSQLRIFTSFWFLNFYANYLQPLLILISSSTSFIEALVEGENKYKKLPSLSRLCIHLNVNIFNFLYCSISLDMGIFAHTIYPQKILTSTFLLFFSLSLSRLSIECEEEKRYVWGYEGKVVKTTVDVSCYFYAIS